MISFLVTAVQLVQKGSENSTLYNLQNSTDTELHKVMLSKTIDMLFEKQLFKPIHAVPEHISFFKPMQKSTLAKLRIQGYGILSVHNELVPYTIQQLKMCP